MLIFIVIVTTNRPKALGNLLNYLDNYVDNLSFSKIIVVGASHEDFPSEYLNAKKNVEFLLSPKGMTCQRNVGMKRALHEGAEIISFLDDDFLPKCDYFKNLARLFISMQDLSMADGDVVADGRSHRGFTYDEGLEILSKFNSDCNFSPIINEINSIYGCNMSVRASLIGETRFDENLPLYSWLEDLDFSLQMAKKGKLVRDYSLKGVHLSEKSGKNEGTRYGYSQIINPTYLYFKGSLDFGRCAKLILRPFLANFLKYYLSEPWIDRKGRFKGNLLAFFHLTQGKIDPTYILKL